MTDRYTQFATNSLGRSIVRRLGLPAPVTLRRRGPGQPDIAGPVLVGGAKHGRLGEVIDRVFAAADVEVRSTDSPMADADGDTRYGVLVFDATGITQSNELRAVYDFFHPVLRRLAGSGRLIVLGTPPEHGDDPREAAAQQALLGFVKSAGKEIGRGSTAQLIYVAPGGEAAVDSTLRFVASARSAYVSGQAIRVGPAEVTAPADPELPLAGQTALVTGAARGIGAVIAEVLAGYGARVVCLDVPAAGADLTKVANRIGGVTLQLDITGLDAPQVIADHFTTRHDGLDILVHNAGITRDKTLRRMSEQQWDSVIEVNLTSQERIDDVLLSQDVLNDRGRIVSVSSISGIAGNAGQTNYAASKAGVAGRVAALAPALAERGGTVNAVAPGFIETDMTARIPPLIRQAGRLMNSMAQGGLPVDVAETIAWLADPGSAGVNGNLVRVCGQSLLGA
ncbi:MAG TPA: 3-oxoacyl-ACP reductase [Micromonosporaceae bacterium]